MRVRTDEKHLPSLCAPVCAHLFCPAANTIASSFGKVINQNQVCCFQLLVRLMSACSDALLAPSADPTIMAVVAMYSSELQAWCLHFAPSHPRLSGCRHDALVRVTP